MGKDPAAREVLAPARKRVSHYELICELGRGGMGIVYRAMDLNLGREVALKCPGEEYASKPQLRHRLLREARAAAKLTHPHIVPIFDVFVEGDLPWVSMGLIEGRSLRDVLKERGPLPVVETLRLAEGLADALQAAHERHVIHRDVKPTNILVTPDGTGFIADFGLAKHFVSPGETSEATTESAPLTAEGGRIGTPGYMSPEQILGRPTDPRSDIFSFGAVLYEMCTGRPAFAESKHGDDIDGVLHHEPVAISRLNYEVPEELERIIRKSLAKRPDERYQTGMDLRADLSALRRRLESSEQPAISPQVPGRGLRSVLVGLTVVLGVAGLVAVWWLGLIGDATTPLHLGTPRQVTSEPGWEAEPSLAADGALIAFSSNKKGYRDVWIVDSRGGTMLQLTHSTASDRGPSWFPDGSALAFVSDRGHQESIWKIPALGGGATLLIPDAVDPAVSPDGTRIAFARRDARGTFRIGVASLDEPSEARILTSDEDGLWDHRHPAWSPDGKMLCYQDQRNLWLIPSSGGRAVRLTSADASDATPAWSSDGRYVFFSSLREGTLALWRVPIRGGRAERLTVGTGPETEPSVSRNGSRMAYSTFVSNVDLILLDVATGLQTRLPGLREESMASIAPDRGSLVFVSDRSGNYDLWIQALSDDRPQGAPLRLTDHPGTSALPTISPDGRWIAYYRVVQGQRDVWILPMSGGSPVRFTDNPAVDMQPAWSPDGRRLAFVSDRDGIDHVWVAPVEEGRPAGPARRLTAGEVSERNPAWSRDGLSLAFISTLGHESDIRVAAANRQAQSRKVLSVADAAYVKWDVSPGWLLVSADWDGQGMSLRRVSVADGSSREYHPAVSFGGSDAYGDFDLSRDGNLLVFTDQDTKGDLWVLEAPAGSY